MYLADCGPLTYVDDDVKVADGRGCSRQGSINDVDQHLLNYHLLSAK